mmetsp:Transcript_30250/g.48138  ORF Transcript_30250/g.48138 Transcript_30250/m.48138 type:complete len:519 (-) Transcript_30250:2354-3910(-)
MVSSLVAGILGSVIVVSRGATDTFVAIQGDQLRMISVVDNKFVYDVGELTINNNWGHIRNSPDCLSGGPRDGCVLEEGDRRLSSVATEINSTDLRLLEQSDDRYSRECYNGASNHQAPYDFAQITQQEFDLTAGVVKLNLKSAPGSKKERDGCTAWRVQPGDIQGRNEENLFMTNSHCFEGLDLTYDHWIEINYEQVDCAGVVPGDGPWGAVKRKFDIPLRKVIKRGGGGAGLTHSLDYALFTVDLQLLRKAERHVHVPYMPMSNIRFQANERLYISGHGYGAPKQFSAQYQVDNGPMQFCTILGVGGNGPFQRAWYNCPTVPGYSGSPLISRHNGRVKGLLIGGVKGGDKNGELIENIVESAKPFRPALHRYRYKKYSEYIWANCATCGDSIFHYERLQLVDPNWADFEKALVEEFITENIPLAAFTDAKRGFLEVRRDVQFFRVQGLNLGEDDDRRLESSSLRKPVAALSGNSCALGKCEVCCEYKKGEVKKNVSFDECLSLTDAALSPPEYPKIC